MIQLFDYAFAQNALAAMVLLSVVAGIVGSYIVTRRMVFVAGGITHSSFGGIGIAFYLGVSPIAGALVFAVLTALGVEVLSTRARVREDSAIAILWSLGMAIGLIFMFLTPGYTPNLMGFMFGDVLAITRADVLAVAVLAFALITCAIIFYRPILYVSFAPQHARLTGWPVRAISSLMAVVSAVAIVLSIKAIGIVLVLSLFTIPQTIANVFTRNLARMMLLSALIALVACLAGLIVSFVADLPTGPVVTALLALAFLLVKCLNKWLIIRQ